MQKPGCPDWQSDLLPRLDIRGTICVFVGLWELFSFSCFVLIFKDRASLYIPGQSGTHYMWQASLQFEICLCLLGLKACATMPAQRPVFMATTLRHQRWTGHVKFKLSNVAVSSIFNHQGWKFLSHYQYPSPFASYWFLDQSFSTFFFLPQSWQLILHVFIPQVCPCLSCWTLLQKFSNSCTQELEISRSGGKVRLGW